MTQYNNRTQPPAGSPRYQGGRPAPSRDGKPPQRNGRGFNPNRKRKKFPKVTVTRGLLRYRRSQDIQTAFVNVCKEKMKPEMFATVMRAAKSRVDEAHKKRQAPAAAEILSAIKDDLREAGIS